MKQAILVAALVALAACSGGGGSALPPVSKGTPAPTGANKVTVTEAVLGSSTSAAAVKGRVHTLADTLTANLVVLGGGRSHFTEPALITVTDSNNNPVNEPTAPTLTFSSGSQLELDPLNPPMNSTIAEGWYVDFAFASSSVAPAQSTLTAVFGDGATGTATIDTYDSFYISPNSPDAVSVTSGVAAPMNGAPNAVVGDVSVDTAGDVTFTNGYMVGAQASINADGSDLPAFATYLTAKPFVSAGTTIPAAELPEMLGDILQAPDANGVEHKYMLIVADTGPAVAQFLDLTSVNGTFAF